MLDGIQKVRKRSRQSMRRTDIEFVRLRVENEMLRERVVYLTTALVSRALNSATPAEMHALRRQPPQR